MKIVLISRSLPKLQAVAMEIYNCYKVETAIINVDFTSGPEMFEKIKDGVKGKQIGVLVNNVGMGYNAPDKFLNIPGREKMIQDILKCNVTSMSMMCSIVLPQMVQMKRGIIINISSMCTSCPTPELTVYSASKAFVNEFSQDLAAEYKQQGIIVQSIIPGPVAMTNMSKIRKSSFLVPKTEDFVKAALKTVGFSEFTAAYWPHIIFQKLSMLSCFLTPSAFLMTQRKDFEYYRNREIKFRDYVSADFENDKINSNSINFKKVKIEK